MGEVLVADGSALIRVRIANTIAEMEGYEVVADAENGEEAVEEYKNHEPDIVVIEDELPDKSGREVAEELGLHENAALVFLTETEQQTRGEEQVLKKPFDGDKVEQTIRQTGDGFDAPETGWKW